MVVTRLLAGGLLVAASLSACQSGTASPSLTSVPSTEVKVFAPFGPSGLNKDISVVQTVNGSCWEQSIVTSRPDAFRCLQGNMIEDPCFLNPYPIRSAVVACPTTDRPSSPNEVLVIRLTKHLPYTYGAGVAVGTKSPPFMIVLTDGTICTPFGGTRPSIGGLPVNYDCTGRESSLVGDIDRTSAIWSSEATVEGQSALVTATVARVYV